MATKLIEVSSRERDGMPPFEFGKLMDQVCAAKPATVA
jgi:hypothetical protein